VLVAQPEDFPKRLVNARVKAAISE